MKLYFKLAAFGVATLAWWGMVIPSLISADSDMLLIAGVAAIIAYPAIVYKLFTTEIKKAKEYLNEL
jgi:hypothetical protein